MNLVQRHHVHRAAAGVLRPGEQEDLLGPDQRTCAKGGVHLVG